MSESKALRALEKENDKLKEAIENAKTEVEVSNAHFVSECDITHAHYLQPVNIHRRLNKALDYLEQALKGD